MKPRHPFLMVWICVSVFALCSFCRQPVQAATDQLPHRYIPSAITGITGDLAPAVEEETLPPISVTAYLKVKNKWKKVAAVYSDADHVYLLPGLTPGSYRLRFSDPSKRYQTEYYEDAPILSDAIDIVVVEGYLTSGLHVTMTLATANVINQIEESE